MISSGGSIGPCPAGAPSACSTAPTTRTCWWCGCAASRRSRSGGRATSRSTCSSASWSRTARSSSSSCFTSRERSSGSACWPAWSDPEKYWKFNAGDLAERELWDEYTEAYGEVVRADQHRGGTLVRGPGGQQTRPGRAGGAGRSWRRWSGWTRDSRDRRPSSRRSGRRSGVEAQILPSGPTMTKVSVLPSTKNGPLVPRLSCSAFISRALVLVTTTPSCMAPVGPPFGGTKLSQSSVYSGLEKREAARQVGGQGGRDVSRRRRRPATCCARTRRCRPPGAPPEGPPWRWTTAPDA